MENENIEILREKKKKYDSVIASIRKVGGTPSTSGAGYYGVSRVGNISLRKLSSLIKNIRTKKGSKVGHMGMSPALMALPNKSMHKLQTKLEELFTSEQKYLTAEAQAQRAQYATTMKKQDAIEIAEIIGEENMNIFDPDLAYVNDEILLEKANTQLKNIMKAPVVLAKEITQPYWIRNENGSTRKEIHFKPFDELARAVAELDKLPILIEHKDDWEEEDIVGYVKQFRADSKLRAIRGTAYFYENRLPQALYDKLTNDEPVAVSIGFMAELGGSGLWEGILYDHTQENIVLEHLAIILDSIPRCPIDLCGVNVGEKVPEMSEQFTIINKGNYYYNIDNIIDLEETRIKSKDLDKKHKSDNMTDDSFVDPKTGNVSGDEEKIWNVFLGRLRRYINGETDLVKDDFAKKMINEILHMNDTKGEDMNSAQKGEDMKDMKEFEDVMAKKDEEITALTEIVKDSLIKEITEFTDSEKLKALKLEDKCVHDLKVIRDATILFKAEDKAEPDVLPAESKAEKKQEMEDAGVDPSKKTKKWDVSEINAKLNDEFDMTGFRQSG